MHGEHMVAGSYVVAQVPKRMHTSEDERNHAQLCDAGQVGNPAH